MKKSIYIYLALQIAFFSNFALAAGADFAGNGGGRPENNIRYVFHNMYKFIEDYAFHCQKTRCRLSAKEFKDIYKIKAKAFDLSFQPEALVYCYQPNSCPVSFKTLPDEPKRSMVAKDQKIYVNLAHYYKNDLPVSDLTEILSLMFHEMGHLAHVTNNTVSSHEYLDFLGGNIRHYVMKTPFELEFPHINQNISIYYFEFVESGVHTPDTLLNIGEQQVELSHKIKAFIAEQEKHDCPTDNDFIFLNYTLDNLHWNISQEIVSLLESKQNTTISLSGNIELSCNELSSDYASWNSIYKKRIYNFKIDLPVGFEKQNIGVLKEHILMSN